MSKVYIKKVNLDNIKVDLSTINISRKQYLEKLNGNAKKMSYAAWCLLKEIVYENYNIDIDLVKLSYNEFNKPIIEGISFNISHSNNIVVVAISDDSIGVDIQLVDDKIYSLSKYIDNSFDKYELTKHFSAIEAFYKQKGTGIKKSLLKESVTIDYQQLINIDNNTYVLSVCSNDKDIKIINI